MIWTEEEPSEEWERTETREQIELVEETEADMVVFCVVVVVVELRVREVRFWIL